ncbi:Alpha/Beta hydrolase protein [Mycena epipterygia]|nr:Alpha/Beta hydrolase protein [Mycena epipterygia]
MGSDSKDGRHAPSSPTKRLYICPAAILLALSCWLIFSNAPFFPLRPAISLPSGFYAHITRPQNVCPGVRGDAPSYAGHIGLADDTESEPRRSFFWFFEAEEDAENAPIILTFGGGPGATAMLQPLTGQGPCLITPNGTIPNPNRITERFNLLALEHPIGTGYSYGRMTNNSHDAAVDVYDFLQKFFAVFPHLSKNRFIISSESYGGQYIPNIAAVIHERNKLISRMKHRGAVHINLDSLMIANPQSNALSHFRWSLHFRCVITHIYDEDTCKALYRALPACLERIESSLQDTGMSDSAISTRLAAQDLCLAISRGGDTHGTFMYDIRRTCSAEKAVDCMPHFAWMDQFFRDAKTKEALGVPHFVNFTGLTSEVADEFDDIGDMLLPGHLLYEPLLSEGIRVLHFVGAQDAVCAWPGILSFLKLLRTPFQEEFLRTPDIPWPPSDPAMTTVRSVGPGAGNMTYILVAGAGHFVSQGQPALVKHIMESWIDNSPFT